MASTAILHGDCSALAEVFSDYFCHNEDSASEDQDDSEICEADPILGKHFHV